MDHILILIFPVLIILTKIENCVMFTDTFPEIKCGDVFPKKCIESEYRTIDGSCNNRLHPSWGMPFTRYARLVPANYADGVYEPRVSQSGRTLPLARILSRVLNPDKRILDKKYSLAAMEWTYSLTHDLLRTFDREETPENQCCSRDGKIIQDPATRPLCYPALVPEDDPDFGESGIRCFNLFIRRHTDIDRGCAARNGAANQMTNVTHYCDLSLVYGSTDKLASSLREWKGGRLLVDIRNEQEWPPNDNTCLKEATVCYKTGDERSNFSALLASFSVLLLREHNRIANALSEINPHWDDERLYQEARRIFIAEHQYISYYEWMPIFLGEKNSYSHGLMYNTTDYVNDYDPSVDPSSLNEVVAAGLRAFHTLVAGDSNLVNENRDPPHGKVNVNDFFNNPSIIEKNDNYDSLLRGFVSQPQEASDQYYNEEVTVFVNIGPTIVRTDARALDIHRGRDHGLGTYNEYREFCGFSVAKKWTDFLDFISPKNVKEMEKMYECPDDVDFTVGATLENLVPGTLLGPTFLCVMNEQFIRTRKGDRFFFENGNSGSPFTLDQLKEIRKASTSRLYCDNSNIQKIQRHGFIQVSDQNPLLNCDSLPVVNLSLWKE